MEPEKTRASMKRSAGLSVRQPTIKVGSPQPSLKMNSLSAGAVKEEEKQSSTSKLSVIRAATDAGGKSSTSRSSSGAVLQSDGNAALNIRTNLGSTTIVGFMATRRLAKNLLTRFRQDKRPVSHQTIMLPTYQLEPTKLFESWKVQQILKAILDARMRTFRYSPRTAAMLSKILTSECKDEVKKLEFARYKIICVVTLGEKRDQSVGLSSLCVWNTDTDNMASYSWENSQCFCNVTVYGIYHD